MFFVYLAFAALLAIFNFIAGFRKLAVHKDRLIQTGQTWWRTIHPVMPKLAGFVEVVAAFALLAPILFFTGVDLFPLMIIGASAAFVLLLAQLLALAVLRAHRTRTSRVPNILLVCLSALTVILGVLEILSPTFAA